MRTFYQEENIMSNTVAEALYDRSTEEWREIPGFPGYDASTYGRIRTYWYRVRNAKGYGSHRELLDIPQFISISPKEDGHLHTNLYCALDNKRYTRTVQVLVARTFLPIPDDWDVVDYTVDHIKPGPEGKLDNSVWNLQWLSRADNIRKAYRDGVCDERIRRQRRPIMLYDEWTGDWTYFNSIGDVAYELRLTHSSVAHALRKDGRVGRHYIVEYADDEDKLLYGGEWYDYDTDQYY